MSRRKITVLYEDQLVAAAPNNYGPHRLLLNCVTDEVGGDPYELREQVKAYPMKGDSKLRAELRVKGAKFANAGPLVVMFDADRVRACYDLPSDACKRSVLERISAEAAGKLRIVMLERNMEDVVAACCSALKRPEPPKKPMPAERDAIIHETVAAGEAARRHVLQTVPSFERLVRIVVNLLLEVS